MLFAGGAATYYIFDGLFAFDLGNLPSFMYGVVGSALF